MGAYTVPAGAMVAWPTHLTGRDPVVWDAPLAFRPERHLDATDEQTQAIDAAWVSFGRGPLSCVGFVVAQMELVFVLAWLAPRLRLHVVDGGLPKLYGMVVNRPAGGVRVTGTDRA